MKLLKLKKILFSIFVGCFALQFFACGEQGETNIEFVKIPDQDWSIGKYEVTQKEYREVMGENPSRFKGDDKRPVERVSWYDAMEFCEKLTVRERDAGRLLAGYEYTLPTSKQWKIACRAGTTTKYCSGDTKEDLSQVAWWEGNSNGETHPVGTKEANAREIYGMFGGGKTHPVGTKEPNAWGIYDMHGNVWEWCLEKHPYVSRGGSYDSSAGSCESSYVNRTRRDSREDSLGFRVVLVPVVQ